MKKRKLALQKLCRLLPALLLTVCLFSGCGQTDPAAKAPEDGWMQDEIGWMRMYNGEFVAGRWDEYKGSWYYFDETGYLFTGWLEQDGKWYYLLEDGRMATGTVSFEGKQHKFSADGEWLSSKEDVSWVQDRNGWRLAYSDGTFVSEGWGYYNKNWYYFDADGYLMTGWIQVDGQYYYLNEGGAMQTGWIKLENKWYFLRDDGSMQTGDAEIGGIMYSFDGSGAWIEE